MMRRCFLGSKRSLCRRLTLEGPTVRYFSSSSSIKKGLSSEPPPPPQSEGRGHATKIIFGGAFIGAALTAAYKSGYLNQSQSPPLFKQDHDGDHHQKYKQLDDFNNNNNNSNSVSVSVPQSLDQSHLPPTDTDIQAETKVQHVVTPQPEHTTSLQHHTASHTSSSSSQHIPPSTASAPTISTTTADQTIPHIDQQTSQQLDSNVTHMEPTTPLHHTHHHLPQASFVNDVKPPSSLLDEYFLLEKDGEVKISSLNIDGADGSVSNSKGKEDSVGMREELKDAYISKDGTLVLDFLQAIHAAEKRQAELDARILAEEKRTLKEKYEKELKDARVRELMYAEEAAILDKELNKERAKAAATVKSLQEKAEENLKMELERKDSEAEFQLKKAQELAKAELVAAIAREKASQIEKMAEANLNINALCLAFYARSEEARQSHSVHKLALGSLALEDALSKGLPIKAEINALHNYLEGIDRDSLLDLVFSSLPEESLSNGLDTQLELNQKFDALKGTLRHFSLIPPGGGGILAHTLARIASWLKVKEDDVSGDSIESIINRVERFLAEGKLAEAAGALEGGVSGSQAEEIIGDWVRQARDRAIAEQALCLLQSYAISVSVI